MVAQGALALSLGFLLLAGTVAGKQNAVDPFERVNFLIGRWHGTPAAESPAR
jgi:hypothetical protein